jgi:hypothetical protein
VITPGIGRSRGNARQGWVVPRPAFPRERRWGRGGPASGVPTGTSAAGRDGAVAEQSDDRLRSSTQNATRVTGSSCPATCTGGSKRSSTSVSPMTDSTSRSRSSTFLCSDSTLRRTATSPASGTATERQHPGEHQRDVDQRDRQRQPAGDREGGAASRHVALLVRCAVAGDARARPRHVSTRHALHREQTRARTTAPATTGDRRLRRRPAAAPGRRCRTPSTASRR